jgi:hypothetical protein
MVVHLFVSVFFVGLALLVSSLSLIRITIGFVPDAPGPEGRDPRQGSSLDR